jgi:MFS family permease
MNLSATQDPLNRQFASNIPRYFVYTALKGFGFGLLGAMWVIFLTQQRGLSLAQASLVDVMFFVAAAFGEVPTGIVADRFGRKISLIAGSVLLSAGILGWTFSPTLPLIMLSYFGMGVGFTFLSGAEDALFYESVQLAGRADDYTRLVGKAGAVMLGALAVGSAASGLLASINLVTPMVVCGLSLLVMLGIVLTLKEPQTEAQSSRTARRSFDSILRQSLTLMRARPTLLYPMIYLALVPIASFITETLFLQPQAQLLGVSLAGIGLLVMAAQLTDMLGSNWSDRLKARFGEGRLITVAPAIILASLIVLALFQKLPVLIFIAVIGFFTSVIRPILLNQIQNEVSDEVRATIISMNSLMNTVIAAISQPTLGFLADKSGFPAAYLGFAGGLGILLLFLFWKGHPYLLRSEIIRSDPSEAEI